MVANHLAHCSLDMVIEKKSNIIQLPDVNVLGLNIKSTIQKHLSALHCNSTIHFQEIHSPFCLKGTILMSPDYLDLMKLLSNWLRVKEVDGAAINAEGALATKRNPITLRT